MFQASCLATRTCDVRELPILHRTRPACGRRGLVLLAPSIRRLPFQLHAEIGMATGFEGAGWMARAEPDRRIIEGHCGRVFLLACALVRDPIMHDISACSGA